MKKFVQGSAAIFLGCFLSLSTLGSAHQPHIVEKTPIVVADPEISKAYYATLENSAQDYRILSEKPFTLHVTLLVPDIHGQKKTISATILQEGKQIALLDGTRFEWSRFFEPFGRDTYWMGPEYTAHVKAGRYTIRINGSQDTQYALAIGKKDVFGLQDVLTALRLIPQIKREFFHESPIGFILSPFGFGLIVVMFLSSFIFGLLYRAVLKTFSKNTHRGRAKNIGLPDRLLRATLGVGLFLWAITTTWSPITLFFSGFCLFEALFSWCGFYAAIGKNSCPI